MPQSFSAESAVTVAISSWSDNPYKNIDGLSFGSNMISVSFYDSNGIIEVRNLEKKIYITIPVIGNDNNMACKYWNTTNLDWEANGCRTIIDESHPESVICQCDHLTDFILAHGLSGLGAIFVDFIHFSGIDKNFFIKIIIVFFLLIPLTVIFIGLAFWGCRKDQKFSSPAKKLTPLPSSSPDLEIKDSHSSSFFSKLKV